MIPVDHFFGCLCAAVLIFQPVLGQSPTQGAKSVPGFPDLFRRGAVVLFPFQADLTKFPQELPRFAAGVRSISSPENPEVTWELNPEVNSWLIAPVRGHSPARSGHVVIQLGSEAKLLDEISPQAEGSDGSIWLPAHAGEVSGTRLRYEPQPQKNTIGYWTEATDSASWRFLLDRPGRFNIAVLQGCGRGQGGSLARISIRAVPGPDSSQPENHTELAAEIEFEVKETGHFQNFQWLQLEAIQLNQSGTYELTVSPKVIRKNALVDIRAIHLIRLPD
jgi:hypothetical protein